MAIKKIIMPSVCFCVIAMNVFSMERSDESCDPMERDPIGAVCLTPGSHIESDVSAETVSSPSVSLEDSNAGVGFPYTGELTDVPRYMPTEGDSGSDVSLPSKAVMKHIFFVMDLALRIDPKSLSSVQMLEIQSIKRGDVAYLTQLLREVKELKHLCITGFDGQKTMDAVLEAVEGNCVSLVGFSVFGLCGKRVGVLNNWPHLETLQHLSMEKVALSGKLGSEQISEVLPALRSLTMKDIVYAIEYREMFAVQFSRLKRLERLEIAHFRDLSLLSLMGSLGSLRYLILNSMELVEGASGGLSEPMLSLAPRASTPFTARNVIVTMDSVCSNPWIHELLERVDIAMLDFRSVIWIEEHEQLLLQSMLNAAAMGANRRKVKVAALESIEDAFQWERAGKNLEVCFVE